MSLTLAEELQHVISVEPVHDSDALPGFPARPAEGATAEDWQAFEVAWSAAAEARRPKRRDPLDHAGDTVRVYERDDPDALALSYALNTEKGVWTDEVWTDIVAMRHANVTPDGTLEHPELRAQWEAMDQPAKWAYHVQRKAPRAAHAAWWVGFRGETAAHARLLDRAAPPGEVWIQWIVGTRALGRSGQTLFVALWDIGVRWVRWKFLPHHGLKAGHWEKFPGITIEPAEQWEVHHPGHYLKGTYYMTERPDRDYLAYRRSA